MTFRRVLQAWDRFLFEPVSPVPVALYRIAFGTTVLLNLLFLLPDMHSFFGEQGVLSRAASLEMLKTPRINVLVWLPEGRVWLVLFFAVAIAAALSLTVGFFTRTSAVIVWACVASLHHRNPAITHAGDSFMRVAAFYLIFSAAGRSVSVDRWLRVRRGVEPPGAPPPVAPLGQRLIQVQLAIAYLATVYWKLHGHTWVDGTAVYYATRVREYDRFFVPYLFDHLWTVKLLTWGTLAVEVALGVLVWFRDLRYPVLLAGAMLHLGLEYSMNIQLFQWVMLSAYVLFIDPRDVRLALGRLTRRRRYAEAPQSAGGDPGTGGGADAPSPSHA